MNHLETYIAFENQIQRFPRKIITDEKSTIYDYNYNYIHERTGSVRKYTPQLKKLFQIFLINKGNSTPILHVQPLIYDIKFTQNE